MYIISHFMKQNDGLYVKWFSKDYVTSLLTGLSLNQKIDEHVQNLFCHLEQVSTLDKIS